eukprot:g3598.t1
MVRLLYLITVAAVAVQATAWEATFEFTLPVEAAKSVHKFQDKLRSFIQKKEHEAELKEKNKELRERADFVGGESLEGFTIPKEYSQEISVPPMNDTVDYILYEPVAEPELSCTDQLVNAFKVCSGEQRCSHNVTAEEAAEYEEDGLVQGECDAAVQEALARLPECGEQHVCPKKLGEVMKYPLHANHFRGPEEHKEKQKHHHGLVYSKVLRQLENDNVCECGGRISANRFVEILHQGCGGMPGVEPGFLFLAAFLVWALWFLIYLSVFRHLQRRYVARHGSYTFGTRCCHALVSLPIAAFVFNALMFVTFFSGPFFFPLALLTVIALRRRRALNAAAPAVPQRPATLLVAALPGNKVMPGDTVVNAEVVSPVEEASMVDGSPVVEGTLVEENETA